MKDLLICVPTYNRKKLSKLVIEQLYKNRNFATLHVYNDHSTIYDNDYLAPYCDEIFKLAPSDKKVIKNEQNIKGMGVQHLRWYQFREFLKTDFKYLYFTDNDAYHDPDYTKVLEYYYKKYKTRNYHMPVSLYNTIWHSQEGNTIKETDDIYIRKTAAGISQMYDREMVQLIVDNLDKYGDPIYGWDYACLEYLKRPVITSKTSYVEHFGADDESMHSSKGQYDRDRAINPTQYLADHRDRIIDYLENDIPLRKKY